MRTDAVGLIHKRTKKQSYRFEIKTVWLFFDFMLLLHSVLRVPVLWQPAVC